MHGGVSCLRVHRQRTDDDKSCELEDRKTMKDTHTHTYTHTHTHTRTQRSWALSVTDSEHGISVLESYTQTAC